ncbi:adenylate/guanylate cyclase domain-containing protein [Oscillatoria sp. FACHB-1406]|uniref:adenylate/guanylate cyclase domain-containing protein n=1 Tax=Oscillatoria sp. FACHB-1406 TaxID=2692846 RepID=UPI0016828A81|nr:adenylate/guanylate cyclase domain-containing protein [Oscillatoria sp. FACHB-1406]MBD2578544.1 PAS domain S-box protein [Oscillatoria sp. FACHB-1406]
MNLLHHDTLNSPLDSQTVIKNLFKISSDLLCLRAANGYFVEINRPWVERLGWTLEELRSRPWLEFVCPADRDYTEEMEALALSLPFNSPPLEYKNRFCCKDGSQRWLQWRVSPYEEGISCAIAKDVTDNRWQGSESYRQAVQEAVQLRDRALAASSVGIVIADARLEDMPLIYVNPAFEEMTGYSAKEVLGSNCRFLQGKKTDRAEVDRLRAAIRAGEHCTVTLLNYRKDKTPFWNELTISPVYDERSQLTHFIGIQVNVTARITAEHALRLEKRKSETLLLNILPKPIVEQLKQVNGSLAQQFPEVTILFADLVGFTSLSAQMQPIELVALLNQIFSAFDRLAEKHGIEKIKTLGDAYMAVGGLPIYRENHAEAIAEFAIEMQAAIAQLQLELNKPLQMRIGINTGSVVAGVIGIKKFIYDLWGDAVNVASRMESLGEPGKIQVSAQTYQRLKRKFFFERRGKIQVKGKGTMTTYWLLGRK